MKASFFYRVLVFLVIALQACAAQRLPVREVDTLRTVGELTRQTPLSDDQLESWPHLDIIADSVPGISLAKAHAFLKGKQSREVVVAVIDGSLDVDHEDLAGIIWTNNGEIPGNGIDDDGNGFVDDVHGWNFLGSGKGNLFEAQLEITRTISKLADRFEGKAVDRIPTADTADFNRYQRLKPIFEQEAETASKRYMEIIGQYEGPAGGENLKPHIQRLEAENRFHYNLHFDPRGIIGDDPDDLDDNGYGNPDVGVFKEKDGHGTHVAGIIAAMRNNGVGVNGIADHVRIMAIRAIPQGDEYDKDVALAIRYAVDNGACIVNMSFGKDYSPHSAWVYDALKYAESKDVLLVQAAGNNHRNLDSVDVFPNDSRNGAVEFVDNFIAVGAVNRSLTKKMVAQFSNYGKERVDLFAPGTEVYSTLPGNRYGFDHGTSMAAPMVAGVAALIRSHYPKLTAAQVKGILMESGVGFDNLVVVPGGFKARDFEDLSVSGRILNAYNAVILAERLSQKE